MLKELLSQLYHKLENEKDNDRKSKTGCFNYFVERILEERYGKPNYISSKAIKGYFEKYVEGRENNAGEPGTELKNIMSQYLGYQNFLNFETKNGNNLIGVFYANKRMKTPFAKALLLVILISILSIGIYYKEFLNKEDCIVWKLDHYEKIDCKYESPNPLLKGVNIEEFKKVKVSNTTTFFVNGHPAIWYGKSEEGELEYFNSRGVHPITLKELKPITEHIINKYVYIDKN